MSSVVKPAHLVVDDLTEPDLVATRGSVRSSCSVRSGMWRGLRRVQWPCASSCATPVTGSCSSTRCRAAHASQRVCEQGCPRRCDLSSHWCVCVQTPTSGLRARVLQSRCAAIWAFACRTPCRTLTAVICTVGAESDVLTLGTADTTRPHRGGYGRPADSDDREQHPDAWAARLAVLPHQCPCPSRPLRGALYY